MAEREESKAAFKADHGKDRWDLLPWDAVREVVRVLTVACSPLPGTGQPKYPERNWEKGINVSRYYGAAMRHMTAWWGGEDNDPETKLPHLAHAVCCILFMLATTRRGMTDFDDRPLGERQGRGA